jgi:secondary thiamine-phosphate synthase enzyme
LLVRLTVPTKRRSQLEDVTERVQQVVANSGVAEGICYVIVPHTTAGVTINEAADPAVARDLEAALEQIVDDEWSWQHVEDPDGPNAPSHVRASLLGPQVLVPVDGGRLALGKWQGIFFCELDGPRERTVYVTALS